MRSYDRQTLLIRLEKLSSSDQLFLLCKVMVHGMLVIRVRNLRWICVEDTAERILAVFALLWLSAFRSCLYFSVRTMQLVRSDLCHDAALPVDVEMPEDVEKRAKCVSLIIISVRCKELVCVF